MKDFTGHGRTITKEHIPKKHGDLENPIVTDKKFDDTKRRINGDEFAAITSSENFDYGKSTNPANDLPTYGKRTVNIEAEI